MSLSRWHMNRMGLVDFWCYENEVFEFENGHMLLRGSNGSGKYWMEIKVVKDWTHLEHVQEKWKLI